MILSVSYIVLEEFWSSEQAFPKGDAVISHLCSCFSVSLHVWPDISFGDVLVYRELHG